MQEIKLTGCQQQKSWEWKSPQANIFNIREQALKLKQWQEVVATLINEVKNFMRTILAATAIVQRHLTLGEILSIQFIIGQPQGPMSDMVTFMKQLQDAKISLHCLSEVHTRENEEKNRDQIVFKIPMHAVIRIANLSFSYSSSQLCVLKELNLVIPHGKQLLLWD
ncbi:MAG: hypothetical protein LUH10_12275 [Tannerellaceae bacterium]|nr:hypothetical protein [Tannerellaceae bacterium]